MGVFFPSGLYGAINKPTGYNASASGLDSFPASGAKVATQVSTQPYTSYLLLYATSPSHQVGLCML